MGVKAFVLIETAVGKTREVYSALEKLEAIRSVDTVTGPYDIIVTIEGDDLNTIGKFVTSKLHVVPGITRTVTCVSIRIS